MAVVKRPQMWTRLWLVSNNWHSDLSQWCEPCCDWLSNILPSDQWQWLGGHRCEPALWLVLFDPWHRQSDVNKKVLVYCLNITQKRYTAYTIWETTKIMSVCILTVKLDFIGSVEIYTNFTLTNPYTIMLNEHQNNNSLNLMCRNELNTINQQIFMSGFISVMFESRKIYRRKLVP